MIKLLIEDVFSGESGGTISQAIDYATKGVCELAMSHAEEILYEDEGMEVEFNLQDISDNSWKEIKNELMKFVNSVDEYLEDKTTIEKIVNMDRSAVALFVLDSLGYAPAFDNKKIGNYLKNLGYTGSSFDLRECSGELDSIISDISVDLIKSYKKLYERVDYIPGKRVKLFDIGLLEGQEATIVDRRKIETDGRGVPINIPGAYKPVDWHKYVAIQYDSGIYDIVAKKFIVKIY